MPYIDLQIAFFQMWSSTILDKSPCTPLSKIPNFLQKLFYFGILCLLQEFICPNYSILLLKNSILECFLKYSKSIVQSDRCYHIPHRADTVSRRLIPKKETFFRWNLSYIPSYCIKVSTICAVSAMLVPVSMLHFWM